MNWWILEVSLGINNVLCNDKRYKRGLGFPFSCSDLRVSSLFLDIKGGFDNVDPSQLSAALRAKGVHRYVIAWVSSFLTHRKCRLLFQGSPRVFSPVAVGTPQGSPISPLVTESIIIATIHCSDVGYCLSRNPLVTHIPYHVPSLLL